MTETSKQPKIWYKRKCLWFIVIIVLLIYFCFVPSRTRISPETTFITEPLKTNGDVDYLIAFKRTYIDKHSSPEESGRRLIIAAIGPRVLEQIPLTDIVTWEEIPTNETSKDWFHNQWIPLCELLYIDPYKKPMFYEKRGFNSYMKEYFKEQKNDTEDVANHDSSFDNCEKLFEKVTAVPWKREDYPEVGKWLDEYSEVLDYYGMCVRKPHFACWQWKYGEGNLVSVLCPDIRANRDFVRNLHVRINERIGRGDIEGAWYDVMTLKLLACHSINESIFATNFVGIFINNIADVSIKLILIHCPLNEEQLAKFVSDLNSLPPIDPIVPYLNFERLLKFQLLQFFSRYRLYRDIILKADNSVQNVPEVFRLILHLPFDANITGKHLTKLYGDYGLQDSEHLISNPVLRRQYADKFEKRLQKIQHKIRLKNSLYRVPLIRTRSELMAECIFVYLSSTLGSMVTTFDRYDTKKEMQQIAIALERYKLANGKYPDQLDELVPKYMDMTPIDPYTGRTSFVYKLRDTAKELTSETSETSNAKQPSTETTTTTAESSKPTELPYILYSLGPDGKDNSGILPSKSQQNSLDYDIVF
ncbi:MAG: hypothetical protein LBC20_10295 [Planctomycetaceae bacterium]|jgi:hypothetical protein|nr:hypothetical protein [Planctomycetaceae bacterium]